MRTLFETSWVRDNWSPNLGQGFFSDLTSTAQTAIKSYADIEKADDARKAAEATAAAQAAAAAAAARLAPPENTILGMSPTTAAIVGAATLAAIIGGVALLSNKKK